LGVVLVVDGGALADATTDHFLEAKCRRSQPLPAAVTPTAASKQQGRREKFEEPSVFLDLQAI
jgi:phage FluMu protein Com